MSAAAALLGYAALLLTAGPAVLTGARWPERAPRLAIAAWFALTGSAVASVLAGGLALMVPTVLRPPPVLTQSRRCRSLRCRKVPADQIRRERTAISCGP
jgi:hypothetical protein